jgi:hypothetical protein
VDRDHWNDAWNEIRRLTGDGSNLFIVKKSDRVGYDALRRPIYGDVWILYRGSPGKPGVARLGRRRDPAALLRLVRKCAPVTA